jgi:DNA-binding NarL/FixJ family response regulator
MVLAAGLEPLAKGAEVIRVLIVDDHCFMRAAIHAVLRVEGIDVVGECSDGEQVAATAAVVSPDVVLMDVQLPGISGVIATSRLLARQPDVRVLMVAGYWNSVAVTRAARAGAVGYLLKGDPASLIAAVRTVAAGGSVWSRQTTPPRSD